MWQLLFWGGFSHVAVCLVVSEAMLGLSCYYFHCFQLCRRLLIIRSTLLIELDLVIGAVGS